MALKSRTQWILCLVAIIVLGILSRVLHLGFAIWDKYLGDALYAAMVYAILRLFIRTGLVAIWAAIIMAAIEFFQKTNIPLHMLHSGHRVARIIARLLGAEFSWVDLSCYAVGIGIIYFFDSSRKIKDQFVR